MNTIHDIHQTVKLSQRSGVESSDAIQTHHPQYEFHTYWSQTQFEVIKQFSVTIWILIN